jgi:hypothetical protein
MAFSERIEKGVIAKLQGMIDAELSHGYGDAISILGSDAEFEFRCDGNGPAVEYEAMCRRATSADR